MSLYSSLEVRWNNVSIIGGMYAPFMMKFLLIADFLSVRRPMWRITQMMYYKSNYPSPPRVSIVK